MVESYLFAFLLWVLVLVSLSFAVLFALCGYVCICIDPHSTTLWVCKSENLGYQSLLPCLRQYIKKLAGLWQLICTAFRGFSHRSSGIADMLCLPLCQFWRFELRSSVLYGKFVTHWAIFPILLSVSLHCATFRFF